MQLMSLSGYGGTTPLFAALWVKTATPAAWQARHGLTAADYQATFNQLTTAGFHPTLVNGYATPNGPRFACIFTNGPTGAWVARHGLTATQYQAAFNDLVGQGYMLDWVSGYFDGQQDLYAAIWRKQANTPAWEARHGLTADDYQAYFNDVVLGLIEVSDDVLLVAGMDVPNIKNVKIGLQTLRLLNTPKEKLRLILNRANSKAKLDVSEVERTLQVNADAQAAFLEIQGASGALKWWRDEFLAEAGEAVFVDLPTKLPPADAAQRTRKGMKRFRLESSSCVVIAANSRSRASANCPPV